MPLRMSGLLCGLQTYCQAMLQWCVFNGPGDQKCVRTSSQHLVTEIIVFSCSLFSVLTVA